MPDNKKADPLGLAIAKAVQTQLPEARVILFGSRAQGSHQPNSDTDLVVIIPNEADKQVSLTHARWKATQEIKRLQLRIDCDIKVMTENEFRINRRARQHIAGQADIHGVYVEHTNRHHDENGCENDYGDDPTGAYIEGYDADEDLWHDNDNEETCDEEASDENNYETGYLQPEDQNFEDHWPATRRRLEKTREMLEEVNERIDHNMPRQNILGFAAHQALENALKGWLSSHNDDRNYGHNFDPLWTDIQKLEDFTNPGLAQIKELVDDFLAYTSFRDPRNPEIFHNWLELYAVEYRYGSSSHQMDQTEKATLKEKLNSTAHAIMTYTELRSRKPQPPSMA